MTLQIVRDWVIRLNFCDPDGLRGGKGCGQDVDPQHCSAAALVTNGRARPGLADPWGGALAADRSGVLIV
ncbi:hypothetical protein HNO88_004468 [Novosphingobium chloroacetimidivorans]|uniref:Uncharacterized protein n=1 Tax=Novosphingobium chloroacetimidivorans TaxID=1428314 RepID=A0A7W7KF52_9SPHN|nr:hypothetical protein [Novosphingobium chloroacetimidivorans]MBB4861114.1 hypothetical protein [Novosphingobium chloroacetimidivorans]